MSSPSTPTTEMDVGNCRDVFLKGERERERERESGNC
jgi:hypothetical protein